MEIAVRDRSFLPIELNFSTLSYHFASLLNFASYKLKATKSLIAEFDMRLLEMLDRNHWLFQSFLEDDKLKSQARAVLARMAN